MSNLTLETLTLIVRIAVVVIVGFLVPQINKFLQKQQIYKAVESSVKAAQQTLWDKDGTVRKSFAMQMSREILDGLHISISDDQLSELVEAAVQEIHLIKGDYANTSAAKTTKSTKTTATKVAKKDGE